MQVAYDEKNVAGAEHYLLKLKVAQADTVRAWLEKRTLSVLSICAARQLTINQHLKEFAVIHTGIGFFYSSIASSSIGPRFGTPYTGASLGFHPGSLIEVTYWVTAGALEDVDNC